MLAVPRADFADEFSTPSISEPVPVPEPEQADALAAMAALLPRPSATPETNPARSRRGHLKSSKPMTREGNELTMSTNYMYRESNYEIGMAAEKAKIEVRRFVKGDRFLAWRKASARKKRTIEKRTLGRGGKKSKGRKK